MNNGQNQNLYFWANLSATLTTLIVSFLALKKESLNWLLYISIPMLIITFTLVIIGLPIWSKINKFRVKLKNEKIKESYFSEYKSKINDFKEIEDFLTFISNSLEWGNKRRVKIPSFTYDIYKVNNLNPRSRKDKLTVIFLLDCIYSKNFYESEYYLQYCNSLLSSGEVTFKYPSYKAEINRKMNRYYQIVLNYNELCDSMDSGSGERNFKWCSSDTYSFDEKHD